MEKISLVIADDQLLFVDLLKSIIVTRTDDFSIVGVAYNGEEAIAIARSEDPDILLLDIRMPGLDGVEVTKVVCSELPDVKVIILTTFPDDEYVIKALDYGASGYLLKNMPVDELITSIRAVHGGNFIVSQPIAKKVFRQTIGQQEGQKGAKVLTEKQKEMARTLSRREREVYELMVQGYGNDEIAEKLFISMQTVKNHISSIYGKIGIHSRSDLRSIGP
jgi:DNA-binding NarL/FixJ family response regulator